jgi:hypothetical protein
MSLCNLHLSNRLQLMRECSLSRRLICDFSVVRSRYQTTLWRRLVEAQDILDPCLISWIITKFKSKISLRAISIWVGSMSNRYGTTIVEQGCPLSSPTLSGIDIDELIEYIAQQVGSGVTLFICR